MLPLSDETISVLTPEEAVVAAGEGCSDVIACSLLGKFEGAADEVRSEKVLSVELYISSSSTVVAPFPPEDEIVLSTMAATVEVSLLSCSVEITVLLSASYSVLESVGILEGFGDEDNVTSSVMNQLPVEFP